MLVGVMGKMFEEEGGERFTCLLTYLLCKVGKVGVRLGKCGFID